VRVTQSDGSEVLFEPAFPTADIPPIGARIRFNILDELAITTSCDGRDIPVVLGIITCLEVLEENAEPCNQMLVIISLSKQQTPMVQLLYFHQYLK